MQTPISVKDKKSFIKWFLNHYQLKKRESVWILNYLITHTEILSKVHFVSEAKFSPRGIIMSSHCSEEVPFRFYKNHLVTTDADKTFHDIRLNKKESLYIQLNYKNANQCATYVTVLEDNPFIPEDYYITKKDKKDVEQLLNISLYEFKRKIIHQKIDLALDKKDQKLFISLVNQLHMLDDEIENQPKLQKQ